jgi:hypothetical protein
LQAVLMLLFARLRQLGGDIALSAPRVQRYEEQDADDAEKQKVPEDGKHVHLAVIYKVTCSAA